METYYGSVQTGDDAILLLHACTIGCLPLLRRNLRIEEYKCIQPGSVFVWDYIRGIRKWTDSRQWHNPSQSGSFSCFLEKTENKHALVKKMFSKDVDGHCLRLVSYSKQGSEAPELQRPSQDTVLKHCIETKTIYSKPDINNNTGVPMTEQTVNPALCIPRKRSQQHMSLQTCSPRYDRQQVYPLSPWASPYQQNVTSFELGSSTTRNSRVRSQAYTVPVSTRVHRNPSFTDQAPVSPSFILRSQTSTAMLGKSSVSGIRGTDFSESQGLGNHFASSQSEMIDGSEELLQHKDFDVKLSADVFGAMDDLANAINILNNVDHHKLDKKTLNELVPKLQRLSIIQLCYYDKPGFPSLHHGFGSRYCLGSFDASDMIDLIKYAIDQTIHEAIQYIRSVTPGSRTDSRLAPLGPVTSEQQKRISVSLEMWCNAFSNSIISPQKTVGQLSPRDRIVIRAEMEIKYKIASICIGVCRFHDESAYDSFKEQFERIVVLVRLILENLPNVPSELTSCKSGFKTRCLPLLEFVIFKCRWLDVRYQAWAILMKLATAQQVPATRRNIHLIGERAILKEHEITIENLNRYDGSRFPLPLEERRIKDLTADLDISDLVTLTAVYDNTPAKVQAPHIQEMLLRCGTYELNDLVECSGGKTYTRQ